MSRRDENACWMFLLLACFLILFFVQPYYEAKTFNRLTGGNATYADAFWGNLRVDGSSQIIKKEIERRQ